MPDRYRRRASAPNPVPADASMRVCSSPLSRRSGLSNTKRIEGTNKKATEGSGERAIERINAEDEWSLFRSTVADAAARPSSTVPAFVGSRRLLKRYSGGASDRSSAPAFDRPSASSVSVSTTRMTEGLLLEDELAQKELENAELRKALHELITQGKGNRRTTRRGLVAPSSGRENPADDRRPPVLRRPARTTSTCDVIYADERPRLFKKPARSVSSGEVVYVADRRRFRALKRPAGSASSTDVVLLDDDHSLRVSKRPARGASATAVVSLDDDPSLPALARSDSVASSTDVVLMDDDHIHTVPQTPTHGSCSARLEPNVRRKPDSAVAAPALKRPARQETVCRGSTAKPVRKKFAIKARPAAHSGNACERGVEQKQKRGRPVRSAATRAGAARPKTAKLAIKAKPAAKPVHVDRPDEVAMPDDVEASPNARSVREPVIYARPAAHRLGRKSAAHPKAVAQARKSRKKGVVQKAKEKGRPGRPRQPGQGRAFGKRARHQVLIGARGHTQGRLKAGDLTTNKKGKIVSAKASAAAAKRSGSMCKAWGAAVSKARAELKLVGWVPVGGETPDGKRLYARAKAIYAAGGGAALGQL